MSKYPDILFFDLEVHPKSHKIIEFGAELNNNQLRSKNIDRLVDLYQSAGIVCGHNIIAHDLPIFQKRCSGINLPTLHVLDTLFLSTLLFPKKPYHHLVKDYHLTSSEINNPISDVELTKALLDDLIVEFYNLNPTLKKIYTCLLSDIPGFNGFFKFIKHTESVSISGNEQIASIILKQFGNQICGKAKLIEFIETVPIELAYAIALIATDDQNSLLPPWLLFHFPNVHNVINSLRACLERIRREN